MSKQLYSRNVSPAMLTAISLLLLGGFKLNFIPGFFNYIFFFLLLIFGGLHTYWKEKTPYTKPILLYCIFLTLSFVYSMFVHQQNIMISIGYGYLYYGPLFYFILLKYHPTFKQTEKFIVALSAIFCICYIIQYLVFPTVIFRGADDNLNINQNQFRMRLPGSLCCYILFFYGMNKFLITRDVRKLLLTLLGFIPIIIMGFRSLLAGSIVGIFLMILFVVHSIRKTIVYATLAVGLAYGGMQTRLVQDKLEEMMGRQDSNQTFDNTDYVRYLSLAYYWNYFDRPGEKIIGAGVPIDISTKYKKDVDYAAEYYGYYWVDLGIIGLSFVIGIPAVLLLLYMYIYTMWKAKSKDLQYIRFCLAVILAGSVFTSMELFRAGNLLIVTILFYMIYQYYIESFMAENRYNKFLHQ